MDTLKSAGRAIIRSPSFAKQSWSSKHKKLPENWTDTRETLLEGMLFNLKYLGMTLVEQPKGEEMSAPAVKRIVTTAKASGKKLRKVTLKVSPRGIILYDALSSDLIENVSIYRISYCTADKVHDKVFAYIVQSSLNETLECHAFLCTKRKVAQAVTFTVAQAFRIAFEFWQAAKQEKENLAVAVSDGEVACSTNSKNAAGPVKEYRSTEKAVDAELSSATAANLVDFGDEAKSSQSGFSENQVHLVADHSNKWNSMSVNNNIVWELDDGLDEAFSRLAHSRTNPQVLDIGVTAQDFQAEECTSPAEWDKSDLSSIDKDDPFWL
ncbi:low density lipoprotein receptor adapter protein 1 [Protopterus annectens]|uniref:low density lipoprotein receptor adapter protein 1 n=1 Tax=Protopterus annectens TaxID=7888 RepID=UPI001CFA54A5|nr:low density lipoprotein receptor adapter protein 1 [Protopterus annectens]